MRIAANPPSLPARAQTPGSGLEKLKDTNPYLMDEVKLNSAISEAEGKVSELALNERKGQMVVVAGSGLALAGMAAMIGSSLVHPATAQMVATAGTMLGGVAVLSAGAWKRDGADMDRYGANLQLDTLTSIRESRFESEDKPAEYLTKWAAALPTEEKLWDAQAQVRGLAYRENSGKQLSLFGKSMAAGTAITTAGTLLATHGHEPIGALIATAVTGAGSAAAWIAGHSKERNAAAAGVGARAQVQTLQQEYDQLMA